MRTLALQDALPGQAVAHARLEEARGAGRREPPGRTLRRARPELQGGDDGADGLRPGRPSEGQSAADLLLDLGLRPDRAEGEAGGLRSRDPGGVRSDEHTSELPSLMRLSYAV